MGTLVRGAAGRAVLASVGLAVASLHGGCVHASRTAEKVSSSPMAMAPPSSAPSPPGDDAVPTVSVDLTRSSGESTTFHKTPTERQKFQVHIDFGKVFDAQGNLDRALQEYRDALKVAESRPRGDLNADDEALAHRRIASALDRLGQFHQSQTHYQKALKLAPKDPKVWNDAGYSAYLQGRWDDAERSLRTALKLSPNDARIRTNLGMVLGAAGKTDEALSLLSANEGDAVGHANLGYLLAATGRHDQARREYQAALAMRPDLSLARRALARLDQPQQPIVAQPTTAIARNAKASNPGSPRPIDPEVMQTSAPRKVNILPPPMPPLPPERLVH